MPTEKPDSGFIKFDGPVVKDHTVPVDVFSRTLEGLQQTLLLIAASKEPTVIAPRRFRPSDVLRRKCELRVGPSRESSLWVPLFLRDIDLGTALLPVLHSFLLGVSHSDPSAIQNAIPDSYYREKAIQESLEYLPKPGQLWHAEFSAGSRQPVRLDQQVRERVSELILGSRDEGASEVVAELVSLNFANERLTVLYKPTGKRLHCQYPVDKEDKLFACRRTQVKLTGLFERDEEGNPIRCIRVDLVEPFDLSPFEIPEATQGKRTLALQVPIVLNPEQDEESKGAILVAKDPELNIYVYAGSRDELIREAENYLFFLWDAYAKADASTLDEGARQLAEKLRHRISESPNGAKD